MVQAHSSLGTGGLTDYQHNLKIEVEPDWKQVVSGWNRVGLEVKAGWKRVRSEFESSSNRADIESGAG